MLFNFPVQQTMSLMLLPFTKFLKTLLVVSKISAAVPLLACYRAAAWISNKTKLFIYKM
jgi:hypothetical protein